MNVSKPERVLGAKILISVGTAMVFESPVFDIRTWPKNLYVNLRTLYRNYIQSFPASERTKLDEKSLLQGYLDEVAEFERLVLEISKGKVNPFFYYPTYTSLSTLLPFSEKKEYNVDGFDLVEQQMWSYVKKHGLMTPFNYVEIDSTLPPSHEPTLLLSSFVVDLLSVYKFPKLLLLESFTGKIKNRAEWYTKINVNRNKTKPTFTVPFNKFTIQIFGDKSGALKGADLQLRSIVRKMAEQDHWSPVTSMDKIKYSISKIKDSKIKELLLKYL